MLCTCTRGMLVALLWLGLASRVVALQVPYLSGRVVDQAGLLGEAARARITSILEQLEQSKGAQVAVLTIPSLQGELLENFSIRVVETWKLGRQDVDDGVLLLVARDDRKMRIEVGYGLEGVLTDLSSRRVIDNLMVPSFRDGDFEGGIESAVKAISGAIRGEADAIPAVSSGAVEAAEGAPQGESLLGPILFIGIASLALIPFAGRALALKGAQGWFSYVFLAPFFPGVTQPLGNTVSLISLVAWLGLFPILRAIWPKAWKLDPGTGGGGGRSHSRSSSGFSSSGGFSGGGGSFGGGRASGGW